jgi:hypothetical protein
LWQKPDTREDHDAEGADDNEKMRSESDTEPWIWIEKTLVKGRADREQGEHRLGLALWSPQKSKSDVDIYKNMRAVREGDVVLHLIDNRHFSGVSVAAGRVDTTFQATQEVGGVSSQRLRYIEILLITPWEIELGEAGGYPFNPAKKVRIAKPRKQCAIIREIRFRRSIGSHCRSLARSQRMFDGFEPRNERDLRPASASI